MQCCFNSIQYCVCQKANCGHSSNFDNTITCDDGKNHSDVWYVVQWNWNWQKKYQPNRHVCPGYSSTLCKLGYLQNWINCHLFHVFWLLCNLRTCSDLAGASICHFEDGLQPQRRTDPVSHQSFGGKYFFHMVLLYYRLLVKTLWRCNFFFQL